MKVLSFATVALLAVTSAQISAAEFTKYVGFIKTKSNPVTLAADPDGNLYYGCSPATLEREVVFIQNPNSKIGNEEAAGTVVENISFASGRIIQGLGVTSDGTKLFMTGDNGGGTPTQNVRRYDITSNPGENGPSYSWNRNTEFENTFAATDTGHGLSLRFGGIAIISESGNGLIAAQTFQGIVYFDFNGNKVGTAVTGLPNYHREPVYNSQHNLIYPLRNGENSAEMLRGYISGIDPVNGGGTWNPGVLISDGAWNTATAGAAQHGFYYAAENQLVTLDTLNTLATPASDAKIRVWNTGDDGKTFTLAYSLSPSQDDAVAPNWSTVSDAVITNNRLYVSVSGKTGIYVYEAPGANVDNWSLY